MKNLTQRTLIAFQVLLFFTAATGFAQDIQEFEQKRNQLIGYMLSKELPAFHFSHKKMNESQSMEIFNLYLKQLDYRKRFLLRNDVKVLHSFAPHIADDLERGTNGLPKAGYDIMKERIGRVEKMVDLIMATGFDVQSDEVYETDPQKIDYANDLKELEDRWRKMMKERVIYRYLKLAEDRKKAKDKLPNDTLWQQAKEKESKVIKEFFLRLNQEILQDHYDRFFNAIARSFDPHTEYLSPTQRDAVEIEMRGNLEGVGATLRNENGLNKVVSVVPGGPAAKQGMLQPEDIILQMAEKGANPVDITDMRPGDAAHLIRGAKGTEVLLTVQKPDGTQKVIPIIRDVVQIEDTLVKDTVIDASDGGKFGYILIPSFYRDFAKTTSGENPRNATDDTRKAIRDLEKSELEGIILDLRNDGGGSVIDAIDIVGLFIKSGPVVQVKAGTGKIQVLSDDDADIEYSGPLVVLVNKFSASASEIVAAALQDYQRAIIVGGEHTYGKGTVQITRQLNKNLRTAVANEIGDLGLLKLTSHKFYRITGDSTQYKGFAPDIILPSVFQHLQTGEKYLDYSLPWDHVEPVEYTSFSGKPFDLDMIRKMSRQRVERNSDLQTIAKEAKWADERSRQSAISLKLEDVRQKVEEARGERKRLSGQFQNSLAGNGGFEQLPSTDGKDMKNDDILSWQEEVKKDPYVIEAINIIVDMKR
jgi:carboxyl-terminal processing protease